MIFRFVRPSRINEWLKNNHPTTLVGTPGDNWKKFLTSQGGTGETFHDLEQSYLASQGSIFSTIHDRWSHFVNGAGYNTGVYLDRMRAYFGGIVTPANSYYLLEDGVSRYQLEDGSGFYILE